MRSTWTDQRLDDFKSSVDVRLDALGVEVGEMRGELGALQRTLIQVGVGLVGAMLVGFVGLIASVLIALL
jgi:hypothetical protein